METGKGCRVGTFLVTGTSDVVMEKVLHRVCGALNSEFGEVQLVFTHSLQPTNAERLRLKLQDLIPSMLTLEAMERPDVDGADTTVIVRLKSLPRGNVAVIKIVATTRSDSRKVFCGMEYVKRLSSLQMKEIFAESIPDGDVLIESGHSCRAGMTFSPETNTVDYKLQCSEDVRRPIVDKNLSKMIISSLFPCIMATENSAQLTIGVDDISRAAIGIAYDESVERIITNTTLAALSMLWPHLPSRSCIIRRQSVDVEEIRRPMACVMDPKMALLCMRTICGRGLMYPGSDTVTIIIDADILSKVRSLRDQTVAPSDEWERSVYCVIYHGDTPVDWCSLEFVETSVPQTVPRRCIYNIIVTVPYQLQHVVSVSNAIISTVMATSKSEPRQLESIQLTTFQVWLRTRGLRGLSRKAGAYYQLTSAPNVLRILYSETTAIQSLLKSAVYEYVECCACTFQCSSSVHDLSYWVQNSFESEIWIITSFSALQGIKDRVFAPSWNSVKCVVFAHLHEAAKASDILSVMPAAFKLVDVCLFPVSVSSTVGANSEPSTKWRDTFEPIDISAASAGADVDAVGHLKDWICRRKFSIPPWSLFCSKLVVFRRIAEDLYQIIMNYNSLKKNVVRVEKLLPCSGVTTILRTVAWKISTSHPGVKCFFVVTGHDGCMGDRQTDVRPSGEDLMLLLEHVAGLESHGECGHSPLTSSSCVQVQPDIVLN
jgi:hypothetical protein